MTDFERGAEAMREVAARSLEDRYGYGWGAFIATVRALPLPVRPLGESSEARLEKALRKAVVQIGILRDRMEGCDNLSDAARREQQGHALSLLEVPSWVEEHRGVLAPDTRPEEKK